MCSLTFGHRLCGCSDYPITHGDVARACSTRLFFCLLHSSSSPDADIKVIHSNEEDYRLAILRKKIPWLLFQVINFVVIGTSHNLTPTHPHTYIHIRRTRALHPQPRSKTSSCSYWPLQH